MSLSEIRVNTTKTRTGVGTITYTETGPVISGIATASNFKTGSTNVHSTGVELANINTGGSTATFGGPISGTTASFTGNVSIGGTLTYEDVTNIDAVGVITAKAGIEVTGGTLKLPTVLQTNTNADCKVLYQHNDNVIHGGSSLHWNPAYDTLKVNSNLISANSMYGAGGTLKVAASNHSSTSYVLITDKVEIGGDVGIGTDNPQYELHVWPPAATSSGQICAQSNGNDTFAELVLKTDGGTGSIWRNSSAKTTYGGANSLNIYQSAAAPIAFFTDGNNERLRITSAGKVGINSTSPTYALEVDGGTQNTVIAVRSSDAKAAISFLDNTSAGYGRATIGGEGDQVYITTGGGYERIRFGTGGNNVTTGISTTANLVTGSEVLSVRGYSSFKSTNKSYAAIYTHNEGNTSGTYNAHILWNAGGANRGGIGYMPNTGDVIINNQHSLIFATGATHFSGTEKLRITGDKVMFSVDAKVDVNNSRDLGASGARWKRGYFGTGLIVTGVDSGTVDGIIITNTSTTNNGLSIGVSSIEEAFIWNGSDTDMVFATDNVEKLRISSSGGINSKGNGAIFEQVETNSYNNSWAAANGKIAIKGDLSGGNYFGWRQKSTASGSVTQANAEKKLPSINDFTYPNSSNGMLIASTSKIGFAAAGESPQYSSGVTMLFDHNGLILGGSRAFDCSDSVSGATTALIKLRGSQGKIELNNPTEQSGRLTIKGANSSGNTCYALTNSGKALQGIDVTCTTVGNNGFGGAISFGCGGNGRSAIAARQYGTDDDVNGLSFFTHTSNTGSDNTVESLRIHPGGALSQNFGPCQLDGLAAAALVNITGRQQGANNSHLQTDYKQGLSIGWYTIATCGSGRASARIGIRETYSSRHQACVFYAGHHYGGGKNQNCVNVIFSSGRHSGNPIGAIRIKGASTYDGAMLQVYLRDGSGGVQAFMLGDNMQDQGWIMKNWVADGTDPGGLGNYTNIENNFSSPSSYSDMNEIQGGGMSSGGHIIPGTDNQWTLGRGSYRWNTVYGMSSSINTSDETLKQDIASLTTAEMNAAKRLSALFKTYRWKESVVEKGTDKARTHSGIIAQSIKTAMEAESLDPDKYSFYCIDEWYEDSEGTKLPLETVTRQGDTVGIGTNITLGGNIVVPSGFNKVTRYSVRYEELFAFIAAYNEQRFTSIESRLTALESS